MKEARFAGERRQGTRKMVPDDKQFPVIVVYPDGKYSIIRKEPRIKPKLEIRAHLMSSQVVYCKIRDISENGLCIISVMKFEPKQKVGIFFQLPAWYINQEVGITLICEVVWHKPNAVENGMAHLTGLKVITSTDNELYSNFISQMPSSIKAHS